MNLIKEVARLIRPWMLHPFADKKLGNDAKAKQKMQKPGKAIIEHGESSFFMR